MQKTSKNAARGEHRIQVAEVRLANRLRQLRLDKGLTLVKLAESAGTSQAFLSRVENHKVSLTIAGLERLAQALGVPMATFFEDDERAMPITISHRENRPQTRLRGPKSFLAEFLAADKTGKLMEPMIVDLASARLPMPLKAHPGDEFDYVLEGECELFYGKDVMTLREGDSVYYDSTVPHAARAVADKPCRLLVVVASRDYLFHGDLSKLLNEETHGRS